MTENNNINYLIKYRMVNRMHNHPKRNFFGHIKNHIEPKLTVKLWEQYNETTEFADLYNNLKLRNAYSNHNVTFSKILWINDFMLTHNFYIQHVYLEPQTDIDKNLYYLDTDYKNIKQYWNTYLNNLINVHANYQKQLLLNELLIAISDHFQQYKNIQSSNSAIKKDLIERSNNLNPQLKTLSWYNVKYKITINIDDYGFIKIQYPKKHHSFIKNIIENEFQNYLNNLQNDRLI